MAGQWKFEDINWSLFNPQKVNPATLRVIKAAGVIEYNGSDYGVYLSNVFKGDPVLEQEIKDWSADEIKHGKVLSKWVELADPGYNFEECFRSYVERFPIDVEATASIRGSRAAELLTRCMVEIGTSSYYTAVKEATDEPLLKHICAKIAADELRHYKLFYTHFQRYQKIEKLTFLQRFRIALGRLLENDGDELATAYYTANAETAPYDRKHYTKLYARVVYSYYKKDHVAKAIAMFCKAIGISAQGWFHRLLSFVACKTLAFKASH